MTETRGYYFKIALMTGDILAISMALVAAAWLRYYANPFELFTKAPAPWIPMFQALPILALIWIVSLNLSGLYHLGLGRLEEILRLFRALLIGFVLLGGAAFLYRDFSYSRAVAILMMPLLFGFTLFLRFFVRFLWLQVLRLEPGAGQGLIIGTGAVARHLAAILNGPRSDYRITGMLVPDEIETEAGSEIEGVTVLGSLKDLEKTLNRGEYRVVLVSDARIGLESHQKIAECCLKYAVQYHVVPDIYESMMDRVQIEIVGGLPFIGLKIGNLSGINFILKRIFDLFLSTTLLIISSPLMLASAMAIKISSKGAVFYTQERLGLHGRPFKLIKFRSMHTDSDDSKMREYAHKWIREAIPAAIDEKGNKLYKADRDPRIFAFGAFMRKFSIDELPQLINVFKGDMSVIGPRPPVPYEAEVYSEWHQRRFEALPGITGLWQVSGRNKLSFDEQVRLDIDYIDNWSFDLDLRIALKTVGEVLAGNGR